MEMDSSLFDLKKLAIFLLLTILIFAGLYFAKISGLSSDSTYKVTRVVDGDTIDVESKSEKFSVRLIGIDTPELHKPNTPVQCFAQVAQSYLEPILLGKEVKLVKDVEDEDKYQRKLRYVFLGEENINYKMVEEGYAYLLTIPPNVLYQSMFRNAALDAIRSDKGLWKECQKQDDRVDKQKKDFGLLTTAVSFSTSTSLTSKISSDSSQSSSNSSSNCLIKGNVNSKKDKIYHLPGMRYYDKTNINTAEGDRWFCSEKEAVDNGFRKSSQ